MRGREHITRSQRCKRSWVASLSATLAFPACGARAQAGAGVPQPRGPRADGTHGLHQPGKGTREPGQSVPAQARVLSAPLKENPEAPSPLQPVRTCKEALSVDQETCSHQTPAPWASRSWTHYSPRAERVHKQLLPVPMARRWRAHADPGSIREQPLGQGLHCLDPQSGPAQARPRSLLSWGVSP